MSEKAPIATNDVRPEDKGRIHNKELAEEMAHAGKEDREIAVSLRNAAEKVGQVAIDYGQAEKLAKVVDESDINPHNQRISALTQRLSHAIESGDDGKATQLRHKLREEHFIKAGAPKPHTRYGEKAAELFMLDKDTQRFVSERLLGGGEPGFIKMMRKASEVKQKDNPSEEELSHIKAFERDSLENAEHVARPSTRNLIERMSKHSEDRAEKKESWAKVMYENPEAEQEIKDMIEKISGKSFEDLLGDRPVAEVALETVERAIPLAVERAQAAKSEEDRIQFKLDAELMRETMDKYASLIEKQ